MIGLYDIHCHILPGLDDGARTTEESIDLLKMEYRQGVRHIIFTPHFRQGMFEATKEDIERAFLNAKKNAEKIAGDLNVYLGCEFYVDSHIIENLENRKKFFLANSNYALIEFRIDVSEDEVRNVVCNMLSYNWIPVLAHVERYNCIRKNMSFLIDLSELGAKISINAGSIMGKNGIIVKKFCNKLIKNRLLDLIGSDAHGQKTRKPNLDSCAAYLEKKYGVFYTKKLMIKNPQIITEGRLNSNEEK